MEIGGILRRGEIYLKYRGGSFMINTKKTRVFFFYSPNRICEMRNETRDREMEKLGGRRRLAGAPLVFSLSLSKDGECLSLSLSLSYPPSLSRTANSKTNASKFLFPFCSYPLSLSLASYFFKLIISIYFIYIFLANKVNFFINLHI